MKNPVPATDEYAQRFFSHVFKTETCWLWSLKHDHDGYGTFAVHAYPERLRTKAHRWSYEYHFGPIPDGMCVCHKCDVPACVNPAHLFVGTSADNNHDRHQKGRTPLGELSGKTHLTEESVLALRTMYRDGVAIAQIAKAIGVTETAVSLIAKGRTWKHVGGICIPRGRLWRHRGNRQPAA